MKKILLILIAILCCIPLTGCFNKNIKGREDEFIGASAMWSEIDYASRNSLDRDSFIERLQNLRMQDFSIDEQEAARRIFEMYVL